MFVIDVPYLDLNKTFDSGQGLRWIPLNDNKYVAILKDKSVKLHLKDSRLYVHSTEDEFYEIWYNYLNLSFDALGANYDIRSIDKNISQIAVRAKGVRIIKQDLYECLLTQIIAQEVNPYELKDVIKKLCNLCGTKHKQSMKESGQIVWYEFPTPEQIVDNNDNLWQCGLKKAEGLILDVCYDIIDGWLDFDFLDTLSYDNKLIYLNSFDSIQPNVVSLVAIYCLGDFNIFPKTDQAILFIDKLTDCGWEDFQEWYLRKFKGPLSLLFQYFIYNDLNPVEEVNYPWEY